MTPLYKRVEIHYSINFALYITGLMKPIFYRNNLDAPFAHWIELLPPATGQIGFPLAIDANGMCPFHSVTVVMDQRVRRGNDVLTGPVVFNEINDLCMIVFLKPANEADVGAPEGINILIVVSHRQYCQAAIFLFE